MNHNLVILLPNQFTVLLIQFLIGINLHCGYIIFRLFDFFFIYLIGLGSDQFEPMLHDCHLHRIESPVVISDSNGTELMIRPDGVTLPHGTHVQV